MFFCRLLLLAGGVQACTPALLQLLLWTESRRSLPPSQNIHTLNIVRRGDSQVEVKRRVYAYYYDES